jgi:N-acetylneuraminic acid mutarotase
VRRVNLRQGFVPAITSSGRRGGIAERDGVRQRGLEQRRGSEHASCVRPLLEDVEAKKADVNRPLESWHGLVGRLYVFGGIQGTGSQRRIVEDVEAYDPDRDVWRRASRMPAPIQAAAVAVVGERLYLIGGRVGTQATGPFPGASAAVYEYNPVADTWRTRQPMPTARTGAAAVAVGSRIFVIGGARNDAATTAVEVYDAASDTWQVAKALPVARTGPGAVLMDGRIYVVGGSSTDQPFTLVPELLVIVP